jgi:hypothetical protein
MDVNEQRDYLTLHIKVKGQLVVRNDIDVNEQRDYLTLHLDIN